MTGNAFLPYEYFTNVFPRPLTVTTDDGSVAITSGNYVVGSVGNALTAIGGAQTTSLAIVNQINNITTSGTSKGVTLPVGTPGMQILIFNGGAAAITVFGNATDSATIDGVAGATGVVLTNALRCQYTCVAAATWLSSKLGATST